MSNTLLRDAIQAALYGGSLLVLAAAPVAYAQDQDDAEELETITVVGSRIKRTDIETSQPVFVLEREDLQKTGLASIGDILQELTTNGAALNTTFNNGGNGTTQVALRNLGSNRTLVLVNGRRWVTGLAGAVDLNTIPSSIIERVEILKDGASAIYGSDAIAGVINITTRDTYDGAEASAYLGENEEGDGRVEQYDFTIGSSTDRASVLMNASYIKQEPIFAGDREISSVPLFGFPGNNVNAGASSTTPFGRIDGPGIPGTLVLIPGRPGCRVNADCAPSTAGDFETFDANRHGFNFAPDNYLQTPQERTSIFAQARYNLTDNVTFRSEVLYNERRSSQQLAATPLVLGPIVGANFAAGILVSRDSVYNPFGFDLNRVQYRNILQFRNFVQDADTFRFGSGLEGVFDLFDRSFSWDVSYIYNDNEVRTITDGLFNMQNIASGSGPSFIDATGVARCGTPAAVIAGCVPVNFLGGPTGFTQAMVDYTTYTDQTTNYKKLYNYAANVTGDLFELPAGPLSFAAGYEYRREFGFNQPDAFTASGLSSGNAAGVPTCGTPAAPIAGCVPINIFG
ncbi:MAG TPA: TonB-dependent receptor plug domain-containing protein, partial [Candidatus Saccharimonadia bacterium]|nr:TonB-dependent receptor plug domain-containing protein [Candidatus Saccharimonadia bacterium]